MGGIFASPAMTVATWGFAGAMTLGGYRDRVKHGESPVSAFGKEALQFSAGALLSTPAALAYFAGVPLARAGTTALIGAVDRQTNYLRSMRTPFSHRFEHTETTSRLQQRGLQAIGGAWAHSRMGSEAAAMARRYGR